MRKMSVRRSQQHNRRASKRMSISIVSEHEREREGEQDQRTSERACRDDEREKSPSENRERSTSE